MTTFEIIFFALCAVGFLLWSWWERIQEAGEEAEERMRRNYGRNL